MGSEMCIRDRLDTIPPVIVNCAGAGIIGQTYRITVLDLSAIHHAIRIQPVHMLHTDALVVIPLLGSVVDS